MSYYCYVPGCNNNSKEHSKLRFCQFPRSPLINAWFEAIDNGTGCRVNRKKFNYGSARVCEKHFKPNVSFCLINGRLSMKASIIPSEFKKVQLSNLQHHNSSSPSYVPTTTMSRNQNSKVIDLFKLKCGLCAKRNGISTIAKFLPEIRAKLIEALKKNPNCNEDPKQQRFCVPCLAKLVDKHCSRSQMVQAPKEIPRVTILNAKSQNAFFIIKELPVQEILQEPEMTNEGDQDAVAETLSDDEIKIEPEEIEANEAPDDEVKIEPEQIIEAAPSSTSSLVIKSVESLLLRARNLSQKAQEKESTNEESTEINEYNANDEIELVEVDKFKEATRKVTTISLPQSISLYPPSTSNVPRASNHPSTNDPSKEVKINVGDRGEYKFTRLPNGELTDRRFIVKNFIYSNPREKKDKTIYWRCQNRRSKCCPARIITFHPDGEMDNIFEVLTIGLDQNGVESAHNHEPESDVIKNPEKDGAQNVASSSLPHSISLRPPSTSNVPRASNHPSTNDPSKEVKINVGDRGEYKFTRLPNGESTDRRFIIKNFIYSDMRENKDKTIYWRCESRRRRRKCCPARIITFHPDDEMDNIFEVLKIGLDKNGVELAHNHEPPTERKSIVNDLKKEPTKKRIRSSELESNSDDEQDLAVTRRLSGQRKHKSLKLMNDSNDDNESEEQASVDSTGFASSQMLEVLGL